MTKKPTHRTRTTFPLYGVTRIESTVIDGQLAVTITATEDIEVDLMHAGLTLHGFNASDTNRLRTVLKSPELRKELELLMRKAATEVNE